MLNPDLISIKLLGKTFISQIFYFDELDSTNNFAKQNKVPDGSLVITELQKKGRGRFERRWEAKKGKNLTFSIVKKFDIKNTDQSNIIFSVSFAIFKTLQRIIVPDSKNQKNIVKIKWPNDILINNKKAAGILIETNPKKNIFVIGIGINVNQLTFPAGIAKASTSIKKVTSSVTNLNSLLIKLVKNLQSGFELIEDGKYDKLFYQWKANLAYIDKDVTFIDANNRILKGYVKDFLTNGQIQIEKNGIVYNYSSGEINLQI